MVEYGYNPRMAPDVVGESQAPSLSDLFADWAEAQEQAQASLTLAAERFKWYSDRQNRSYVWWLWTVGQIFT